jgi:ATP-binding cassette, subfamily B, bacterial
MSDLATFAWPAGRLGDAIEALAQRSGLLAVGPAPIGTAGPRQVDDEALARWLETAAARFGLEVEPLTVPYGKVEAHLQEGKPAILRLPGPDQACFLLLSGAKRRAIAVLQPDLTVAWLSVDAVRSALCSHLESSLQVEVTHILDKAAVPARRRPRASRVLLQQRLVSAPLALGWLLRLPPGAPARQQARQAYLPSYFLAFVVTYSLQHLLFVSSWWLLGGNLVSGQTGLGWFLAWLMLLLTLAPLRFLSTWTQGVLAVKAGTLLKQRLLAGALRLAPEEIRHQGVGQLLGRVIESEAVETLTLSGGFLGLVAVIELVVAAFVIGAGAGGRFHWLLLIGWLLLASLASWSYYHQRRHWTDGRLSMTHELVEQMVGHRTQMAQELPERLHRRENKALAHYLALSRATDRASLWLTAVIPRGWLVVGLVGLAPAFVAGSTTAALAVSVGGTLLAFRALRTLARGLIHLTAAAIAWQRVAQLFQAATRDEVKGSAASFSVSQVVGPAVQGVAAAETPILVADNLCFHYQGQSDPVIQACNLSIDAADRILLEGPSGSGKSTLASLLGGLRQPASGLLHLHGLDWHTIGLEAWRRRVTIAPQFHENFVMTETMAFNLLMGRRWPPQPEELEESLAICRELGLDSLLERMPAGLLQIVGESGWQLSHGERSRLYIARALLQGADLIILDESFAALDPESLRCALRTVLQRAPALFVIAHP